MKIYFFFRIFRFDYIHNWPIQPFNQDYNLASHTTYVVYANFMSSRQTERQIFGKLSMAILFTFGVFVRNLQREEITEEIFSYFRFDD